MLVSDTLPLYPERVFVLGGGKFGSSAAIKIERQWPFCHIILVDSGLELSNALPGQHLSGTDAIGFLKGNLNSFPPDSLIVPCVPVHVAFEWVLSHFGFTIPVPIRLMEFLPGAVVGKDGCIYCSLSDFVCPADCSEPEGVCSVTGEKRNEPLFNSLQKNDLNTYKTIVVRSAQLLPGVGAVTARQLSSLLAEVRKEKGRYLIGTASRCHGVIHGFVH
jgi:hypothetical protein